MPGIAIRDAAPGDAEPVRQLLLANGWAHRLGDPDWFARLLAASQRTAVAQVDQRIVGFARGVTDGMANGYLSMVLVAPEQRGRGVGTALVRHVMGEDPALTWVLRADRGGAPAFFQKLGFTASSAAMERRRA